jgi:hypothetical protein
MVVYGGKRIENRVWTTKYRGEFLIHAAKGMTRTEYSNALDFAFGVYTSERTFFIPSSEVPSGSCIIPMPPFDSLQRGGIIGKATLVDVKDPPEERAGWQHDWRMEGQFGFVLENVQPLPFTACSGNRRWWSYEAA